MKVNRPKTFSFTRSGRYKTSITEDKFKEQTKTWSKTDSLSSAQERDKDTAKIKQ